ncbi:MAG TPA: acyl-CoA dehydrogenase [Jatrophihabitantaceae bacterium]|nr:acyl-CoA dehydrogenase [Jatrophihabitantaceae bacterium]
MRFIPSAEQREFGASVRALIDRADVASVLRARATGDAAPVRALWRQLAGAGVTALGTAEKHGGFGADAVDLVIGFTELGRGAVPGPWVESVAVLPGLIAGSDDEERIAAMAEGEQIATLAAPPAAPYAADADLADAVYLLDGATLSRARSGVEHESVDQSRRLVEVRPDAVIATDRDCAAAHDLGALASAAYIRGTGAALLDRATEYAKQRSQFGRAIGSFQAVKHQLADAIVALELAEPLVFAAALAVRDDSETRSRDVSAAKVACTDAAYLSARVALQVHGAIGYTAEYDLALWLTKVRALVSAWGTQQQHRDRVLAALR